MDESHSKELKYTENLFKTYYSPLVKLVNRMVRDVDSSEDIVQEVFLKIWKNRVNIDPSKSVKSYLYRSAINTAINHIERNKKTISLEKTDVAQYRSRNLIDESVSGKELEKAVSDAIDLLPPKCKAIFMMSRYEDLSYKEIAEVLGLSIKTVENQVGKALQLLRERLRSYLK